MNEEKAVLEFFSREENLPLALAVASRMDALREEMNSRFWQELKHRIDIQLLRHAPEWQTELIEDRNSSGLLLGLQCKPQSARQNCLFPILEQQQMGGTWRIVLGLMWQKQTEPNLHETERLRQALNKAGFKSNEQFLAWRWTDFYPRRSDFLLRISTTPDQLLNEVESAFSALAIGHHPLISRINAQLSANVAEDR